MEVTIFMGSKSDLEIAKKTYELLIGNGIATEMKVLSAHRTPVELRQAVLTSTAKVFICFAGGAAHLAGAVAAITIRPVIGVPIKTDMGGIDSLLSTVQMPSGIPVATVAVNGAENAALLAMQMLAISDKDIEKRLANIRVLKATRILGDQP